MIKLGNAELKQILCARRQGKKEEDYAKSEEQVLIAELRGEYPDLSTQCAERVVRTLTEVLEIAHASHKCDGYGELYTGTVVRLRIHPRGPIEAEPPALPEELIIEEGLDGDSLVDEEDVEEVCPRARPATRASVTELLKAMPSGMEEDDANCGICMEGIEKKVVRMPCSHPFHRLCLVRWLHNGHSCPICRYQLPPARYVSDLPTSQGA